MYISNILFHLYHKCVQTKRLHNKFVDLIILINEWVLPFTYTCFLVFARFPFTNKRECTVPTLLRNNYFSNSTLRCVGRITNLRRVWFVFIWCVCRSINSCYDDQEILYRDCTVILTFVSLYNNNLSILKNIWTFHCQLFNHKSFALELYTKNAGFISNVLLPYSLHFQF